MQSLTFVYCYYQNPEMLYEQYGVWSRYPKELKDKIKVIVVDDASPSCAAINVPRYPHDLPALEIYRVRVDIPWHQDGARNLGAKMASDGWLFLCDIDHVLPPSSLAKLLKQEDEGYFYTFSRNDADGKVTVDSKGNPKPGFNIYACTRDVYWRMGGYDEDLCGAYGTDGDVRRRLLKIVKHRHLQDCPIIRYGREHIPDASTTAWERRGRENDERRRRARLKKIKRGRSKKITVLDFQWDRVF